MKENTPMTTGTSPLLTLNNGVQIPVIGLGVFQSPPEQTAGAVESALTQGYRLVDTAAASLRDRARRDTIRAPTIVMRVELPPRNRFENGS